MTLAESIRIYRNAEAQCICEWAAGYQQKLDKCKTVQEVNNFISALNLGQLPDYINSIVQKKIKSLQKDE